jgi:hypothetical protein
MAVGIATEFYDSHTAMIIEFIRNLTVLVAPRFTGPDLEVEGCFPCT